MLSDSLLNTTNGNISTGIEANDSIKAVVDFIKKHFGAFAEKYRHGDVSTEKGLNQKLCIFFNIRTKAEPFFFHHEFMENTASGKSPQVDIGTILIPDILEVADRQYNESDSFFSIEAKRLPTEGTNREKEYVIGHPSPSGAIERFKKGIHGSRLKFAAIIGYVQNNSFDHWFLKVNSWIEELAIDSSQSLWSNNDMLEKSINNNSDPFWELISENQRDNGGGQLDTIKIFHFWINLI